MTDAPADTLDRPATEMARHVAVAKPQRGAVDGAKSGESDDVALSPSPVSWRIGELVVVIDAYAEATGKSRSHWSQALLGKSKRVDQLEAGEGGMTIDTYDSVMRAVATGWPDEAARPGQLIRWEAEDARAQRAAAAETTTEKAS